MWPNALLGLYLISTYRKLWDEADSGDECQCPLGLIPHFYTTALNLLLNKEEEVSMPSRAYTSFLLGTNIRISGYLK